MRKVFSALCAIALAGALVPLGGSALATESTFDASALEAGTYVEHEAVVCVAPTGIARSFSLGGSLLDGAEPLMDLSTEAVSLALGDDAASDASDANGIAPLSLDDEQVAGTLMVVRDESRTTAEIIAELEQDERVLFAEPNYLVTDSDDDANVEADELEPQFEANEATVFAERTLGTANDLSSFQWGFDNDGVEGGVGTAGVDFNYGAWNSSTGTTAADPVVVAVVDTGVNGADAPDGSYVANPDLAGKMWSRGDIANLQDLGDEHGFSACEGGLSTNDENGHGTHCAGVIAAAWDGTGTSGASRNARIMAVQHDDSLESMIRCFDYMSKAREAGVNLRVASCSWTLGASQSRAVDAIVAQVGEAGVTCVFASGNSRFDNDTAASTSGTLRENPYAVVVDSVDPTGSLSPFSNYGRETTDIMSFGSSILSTYPTNQAQFLGEADDAAVLYESFDGESRYLNNEKSLALEFPDSSEGVRQFDGDGSIAFKFDPAQGASVIAKSTEIDLSSLTEKPKYLSIRYAGGLDRGGLCFAEASVVVKTVAGGGQELEYAPGCATFSAMGDAWGGYYVELPEDTDWSKFQLMIVCSTYELDMTGGARNRAPAAGTVFVDSIALGSTLVPYAYEQGTSMACPAVSGTAAVLAETYADASADKLAARVKGSAQTADQGTVDAARNAARTYGYADLCSTGGLVSVDTASDPAPSITAVKDGAGGATVTGYFFDSGAAVALDGVSATVESAATDPVTGKVTLAVKKPAGFDGGATTVTVTQQGQIGRAHV